MPTIAEYERPDARRFAEEIYPAARPAVMRGVGADLEAVRIAQTGTEAFAAYLTGAVGAREVDILAAKPGAGETFFFDGALSRLNFERVKMPFDRFVARAADDVADAPMLYLESTPLSSLSPALEQALRLPVAPPQVPGRLWMGNKTGTHTHFDVQQNIAYVVSGRRRFTLFPPEQTPNLYMAPFEASPSNAPLSLVRIEEPDYARFPRFREAEAEALVADLEPGDAIFIPYMWWHHVKARGQLNVLVNYWWNEHEAMGAPVDAMLHAMLALRDLPPPMRDAWRTMFETFVFKAHGEPMDYLPPHERGAMGAVDEAARMTLWQSLGQALHPMMQRAFAFRQRR